MEENELIGESPNPTQSQNSVWKRPELLKTNSFSPQDLACISEVFILDSHYTLLADKISLRNISHGKAFQIFKKNIQSVGHEHLGPFFKDDGINFFYLLKSDVYIVAASPASGKESPMSLVFYMDVLQRIYQILKECLGSVNEATLRVNKLLVFELLDELLNFGYCFVSNYAEIKPFLTLEPRRPKTPQHDDVASRFFGINIIDKTPSSLQRKERIPNSAYINIVENLTAVLGPDGEIRTCELCGSLNLINNLDRAAPILIQLSPDLVVKSMTERDQVAGAIHIENPSFHSSVDSSQLPTKKCLRVFPPAEETKLMIYSLTNSTSIRLPLVLLPSLNAIPNSRDQNLTLRLILQADRSVIANYIRVKVQLPKKVTSVSTTKCSEQQTSKYVSVEKIAEWEVSKVRGMTEESVIFRLAGQWEKPLSLSDIGPISLTFYVKNFSASGLSVMSSHVERHRQDTSLQPEVFFGVATKSSSFAVRTNVT